MLEDGEDANDENADDIDVPDMDAAAHEHDDVPHAEDDESSDDGDIDLNNYMVRNLFDPDEKPTDAEFYLGLISLQHHQRWTDKSVVNTLKFLNIMFQKRFLITYKCIVNDSRIFAPTIYKYFFTLCGRLSTPVSGDLYTPVGCDDDFCRYPCCRDVNGEKITNIIPAVAMKDSETFFCHITLSEWLTYIVPLLYSKLRFDKARNPDGYHDLADGISYQRLRKKARKMAEKNGHPDSKTLTLLLGYDGAKCSAKGLSLYPIVAFLVELPLNIRNKFGFTTSINAGEHKPEIVIFRKLIEELAVLHEKPLKIIVQGQEMLFYVRVLALIGDCPVRAEFLNCFQHNGQYGCNLCYIKTYNLNHSTVYPLHFPISYRTHKHWLECINLTYDSRHPVLGVKGPCELTALPYPRLSYFCPPEYMHSQLIGTMKLMVESWIGDVKNVAPILKEADMEEVDLLLDSIKYPSQYLRAKMAKFVSSRKWQAYDYECFLLYCGFTMAHILPENVYNNFMDLAQSISLLSKRYITPEDIELAQKVIKRFVADYSVIYPLKMHRFGVHVLEHFPDMVELYGPLYVWSAYPVENMMGNLVRKVKTGTNIQQQVMKKHIGEFSALALMESPEVHLGNHITTFLTQLYDLEEVDAYVNIEEKNRPYSRVEQCFLETKYDQETIGSMKKYQRLVFSKELIFTTSERSSHTKTANDHFMDKNGDFFRVSRILALASGEFVLLSFRCNFVSHTALDHVTEVVDGCQLKLVKPKNARENVTAIFYRQKKFVYRIVNRQK